jgi:ankyrin repeat protein
LITAVATNGIKCVALILHSGVDTSVLGPNDRTVLHIAAEFNEDATIVDLLLKAGAEIDAKESMVLHHCIWQPMRATTSASTCC